jgi:pilus assembly protein FimV
VPTWHSSEVGASPARSGAAPARVEPAVAPAAAVAAAAAPAPASQAPASPAPANPGQERIELARAYLDLGDQSSARQLLGEVLINGDHAARQQAARLLREIEASS